MSTSLEPIVIRRLSQFARRRQQLLLARGVAAGLVCFVLGLAIVGFIDWYWLLGDSVRWILSAAVYVSVAVAVWWTSLRQLFQPAQRSELASRVEELQPELRENLLSAVELAADDPNLIHDSPVFRQLLQGQVAEQMKPLQVRRLLPLKLIAIWLMAALVLTTLAVVLLTSNDSRFRQLATRAMLPGANLARVSRIQVEILEPTPHSLKLAEDETVAVVVEISGGRVDTVTLETSTRNQGSVRQKMQARTDQEFAANIHVADESVEYRILAGDAVTQRFTLEAHPRPHVIAFQKNYHFPDYAALPDETVTESHGDLLVLQGTTAELIIEADQAISQAELQIDPSKSDKLKVVPLVPVDDASGLRKRWSAEVPVDEAAIYKVHLVSSETGFENTFSPKYEIRPQPDLVPRTGFVDQPATTLLLPPNDLLALRAMAEDDLPLASLEQQISVNGRDWETIALEFEATDEGVGRQVAADWQWDLLGLELETGDQVLTKLVALDRKGNTGESIPLRIIVAAADFDPQRHSTMRRKLELFDEISGFSQLLAEQRDSAVDVVERLSATVSPESVPTKAGDNERLALLDVALKQQEQAGQLFDRLKEVEREMPPGADAQDLDLAGRVLTRLQREHATVPTFLTYQLQNSQTTELRQADLDAIRTSFERSADDAHHLAQHYQWLSSHNFLRALAFRSGCAVKPAAIGC